MKEKEAILLIEEMINKTKEDIKDNGFYFILWGLAAFAAALINAVLLLIEFNFHSLPWIILMPLGGIITAVAGKNESKTVWVKTYVSENLKYMTYAFSAALFISIFSMVFNGHWNTFYPTIMIIYAMWLYVSGGILKFKPLIYGAWLNFALAVVCYFITNHQLHLLSIAIAVLGGYIIPGYMLKSRFKASV